MCARQRIDSKNKKEDSWAFHEELLQAWVDVRTIFFVNFDQTAMLNRVERPVEAPNLFVGPAIKTHMDHYKRTDEKK